MREKIFKMIHSEHNTLTPITELKDENIEKIIRKNNLDIDKFYRVTGTLYPYCYINNTVYVEIYSFDEDLFNNLMVKKIIEQREKKHAACIQKKNYGELFCLIDKPYRMKWFIQLIEDIPADDRAGIFKSIYSSMEYGFNDIPRELLINMFKSDTTFNREKFSDVVTIYRGEGSLSTPYMKAYSWTVDVNVAEFFANRFNESGTIYKGYVYKEKILNYIEREQEVIVLGEDVFDITVL